MYLSDPNLARRFIYGYPYGGYGYGNNRFYSWGRWVLLGGILLLALLVFLTCCCHSRRRRRRGMKPIYGTGWSSAFGRNKYGAPPPQAMTGGGYAPPMEYNQGGYYGQNGGVQRPEQAYAGNGGRTGRMFKKW